jgi:23S rRNA (pseudouridine1915-N3)-methyltransferase
MWRLLTILCAWIMLGHVRSFKKLNTLSSASSLMRRYMNVNIFVVAKKNAAEEWITQGCNEYEKRLKPVLNLQTVYCKSDTALIEAVRNSKGSTLCMDENGKTYTSRQFSTTFYKEMESSNKATVNFVIGGFAGLPPELKIESATNKMLSLSSMTWTHSVARLLLLEQIYRATEIHKGSGYHKD